MNLKKRRKGGDLNLPACGQRGQAGAFARRMQTVLPLRLALRRVREEESATRLFSRRKVMKASILGITLLLICTAASGDEQLLVLTEEWPPYNFSLEDEIVGLSADLVKAALARAKLDYHLEICPWKRAYRTALKQPNTLLFTTSRTPQREHLFKWIGPLYPRQLHLYKLKSRNDIQVDGWESLKRYEIGVLRGGSVEELLKSKGFEAEKHYWPVSQVDQNLRKIFFKRIDLVVGSDMTLAYRLKGSAHRFADLEKVFLLADQGGYYLAANKDTPDSVVEKLQMALDALIKAGLRKRIQSRYLQ